MVTKLSLLPPLRFGAFAEPASNASIPLNPSELVRYEDTTPTNSDFAVSILQSQSPNMKTKPMQMSHGDSTVTSVFRNPEKKPHDGVSVVMS